MKKKFSHPGPLRFFNNIAAFPFHTICVPVVFVLHVINDYFGLVGPSIIFTYFWYYMLLSVSLLVPGYLLCRSWRKGGIWATFLLIIFFYFGASHDFLKDIDFLAPIARYTVLLPCILLLIVFITINVRRKEKKFFKLNNYLTWLFSILTVIELVTFTINVYTNKANTHNLSGYVTTPEDPASLSCSTAKPDIFFIVFDEFASSAALQKYFGFDNSHLDSILRNNGFYVAVNSKSNYNSTPYSIGSTLNMNYFPKELMLDSTPHKFRMQGWYSLKNAHLPEILAKHGYKILNYGLINFTNYPGHLKEFHYEALKGAFYAETLWGRIRRDILWNITRLNIPELQTVTRKREQTLNEGVHANYSNYKAFLRELQTQREQPRFVFGHVMTPHSPYVFDKYGKLKKNLNFLDSNTYLATDVYLDQLMYINTWIDTLARAARPAGNHLRPRVVIIEGDHGYRKHKNFPIPEESHFMNLNCYFFSDGDYSLLYDSVSPVNTFRIVMNKYFCTRYPMLPDSCVFLK